MLDMIIMETEEEHPDKDVSCCSTAHSMRSWVVCLSPIKAL